MKYFSQLLEAYSRLHEAQVNPEALANQVLSNAQAAPGQAIPIKQGSKITLRQSTSGKSQGNIVLMGFRGKNVTVQHGDAGGKPGQIDPNGFALLVQLLSSEDSEESPTGSEQPPNVGAQVQQQEAALAYFPDDSLGPRDKINNQLAKQCEDQLKNLKDSKAKSKQIKELNKKCQDLQEQSHRLINNEQGSIARTLHTSKTLVTDCADENYEACQANKDKELDAQANKVAAFDTIQAALDIFSNALDREDKTLSTEECAFLKNKISISGGKVKKIAILGENNRGMLITQDRTKYLHDVLTTMSQGVKCADGEPFQFQPNLVKFLTSAGVGSSASIVRGFFFEDLRAASLLYVKCLRQDSADKSKCQREAADQFSTWIKNKERLTKSLLDLADQMQRDGELATSINDEAAMDFVNGVLVPLLDAGELDIRRALAPVLNMMARIANLGVIERNAIRLKKTATDVGDGKKSDTTEYFESEEEARKAIEVMNLPGDQKNYISVRKIIDEAGRTYYTIGDSLKFSTTMESIKGGQAALSTIMEGLKNKEWVGKIKEAGVSNEDLKNLENANKEYESDLNTIQNLKIAHFLTRDGKKIKSNQRAEAAEAISKQLINQLGVDSELGAEIMVNAKRYIKEGKDWGTVSKMLANDIQKAKLNKSLYSDNPKEVKKAVGQLKALAAFAGCSSDGTLLSVADPKSGRMYTSAQNIHTKNLVNELDKLMGMSPEDRKKLLKINSKSITIGDDFSLSMDGMDVAVHYGGEYVKKNSSYRSVKDQKGMEVRLQNNKQVDYNSIVKLIQEQKKSLENLISLLESTHNQR